MVSKLNILSINSILIQHGTHHLRHLIKLLTHPPNTRRLLFHRMVILHPFHNRSQPSDRKTNGRTRIVQGHPTEAISQYDEEAKRIGYSRSIKNSEGEEASEGGVEEHIGKVFAQFRWGCAELLALKLEGGEQKDL